ncbi:MAG: amidohydrolase family protein, partial [Dokdonella sp.]
MGLVALRQRRDEIVRFGCAGGGFDLGVSVHSLRAVTPEQIRDVLAATPRDMPIHIHVAEQTKEVDDCLAWSGARP